MSTRYPSRIVCLTEETTETLYLLGEGDRIVGISGYMVRPPEARHKPKYARSRRHCLHRAWRGGVGLWLPLAGVQAPLCNSLRI